MPKYRSATTTHGRNMAGARALWRATGMTDADFGKPIIAVVNSFTQFVPGHVHLRDLGKLVAEQIEASVVTTVARNSSSAKLPSRAPKYQAPMYPANAASSNDVITCMNCINLPPAKSQETLLAALPPSQSASSASCRPSAFRAACVCG